MGHPDKVSDQISDAILDAMLAIDPKSRVAVETMTSTGMVVVSGEVTTEAYVDIPKVVREVVSEIGYTDANMRFDSNSCAVLVALDAQSPDIAQGVDTGGAGDQGLMFGFACRETDVLMPLPIHLSHRLVERQAEVRAAGIISGLRPDAKSQVTAVYNGDKVERVQTLVLSTQHAPEWNNKMDELRAQIKEHVLKPVLGDLWSDDIITHINPTGLFEIGGPHGDCGLTGRKIIVDTYGGRGRHGGGAFSGKDPTKVDRSAAYMARYIAKNVVAAELADVCEVQLSYAIGVVEPTSVYIDCQGTAKVDEDKLSKVIREIFQLTPHGIMEQLQLRAPIYRPTARHGHFGRTPEVKDGLQFFGWEKTDKAAELKSAF
jgi:S-adenosylmethionine synthetase